MSTETRHEPAERESKSLAGRRILVTRTVRQAGRLAEALEAKGAEVICLPTIAIVPPESYAPLDAALTALESFDWLIVTSANGVEALAERMRVLKIPLPFAGKPRIASIGPATTRAAREIGLTVDLMPAEYIAESLVGELQGKVAGKRVLLVRAAMGRDVIPNELGRQGAEVQVVAAYQTIIPAESIRGVYEVLGEGRPLPDGVTFTSSSTVIHFLALLQAAGIDRPSALRAVSIGPVTTQTLREHAWEPASEARPFDIAGLVEACDRLFQP